MKLIIRVAEFEDALKLSLFAEETFRETFSNYNSVVDMDEYCRRAYSKNIQRNEILDINKYTIICEFNNEIIGYAQINWNSIFENINDKSQAELQRIYIKSTYHGNGVAHELMEFIINTISQKKIKNLWLGVWEMNPRAINYYKKFKFYEVGEHVFLLGNDKQRDIILNKVINEEKI